MNRSELALPLCGRRARGKPRRGPRARGGRAIRRAGRFAAVTYARYPHYPQADSAWLRRIFRDSFRMWPRRSSGNGGEPSQPQPRAEAGRSPSGGRQAEAEGRAADEAAARRKMRACPSADAKAAGFVKRPSEPRAFGLGGTGQAGHRTFGFRTSPAESGTSVSAPPPAEKGFGLGSVGQDRASARELRTRQDPGLRSMDLPGGTEASAEDPAGRGTEGFGSRIRQGGKRNASSESAKRRTARASALSGSPRGNLESGFGRGWTPEEAGSEPPARMPPSKPPSAERLPPRPGSTRRDSGGRRQRRPPLSVNRSAARLIRRRSGGRWRRANRRAAPRFAARALDPNGQGAAIIRAGAGEAPDMFSRSTPPAPGPKPKPARTGAPGLSFIGPEVVISGDLATDGPAPCRRPDRRRRQLRAAHPGRRRDHRRQHPRR